jgi:hypothetical protein
MLQGPNSNKEELVKLGHALKNWESHEMTTLNYKKNGRILGKLRLDSRS